MAQYAVLARPYAKAAFELAAEKQQFTQWSLFLRILAEVSNVLRCGHYLLNPHISTEQLFDACFSVLQSTIPEVLVDEKYKRFLHVVIEAKRLVAMPEVAKIFSELVSERQGIKEMSVTSAFALDETQKKNIKQTLEKRFASKIEVTYHVDQDLIGGVMIRSDDKVIDGSVRGQLNRLREDLMS